MYNIVIENDNCEELTKYIKDGLMNFNKKNGTSNYFEKNYEKEQKQCEYIYFSITSNNKIIGGAITHINFDWLYIDKIYVSTDNRNTGMGSKLIAKIEEVAKSRDLTGIWLNTWNFQAKGFYEKNGFTVTRALKDFPKGCIDYELIKYL